LKAFAAQEDAAYADQLHAVIDVWAKNKPMEKFADAMTVLKAAAQDEHMAGVEHLRAFLAAQAKEPRPAVSLMGDPVHPGPPGQLTMAAALLKALGADGFVSSVTLDAAGKVIEAQGCAVTPLPAAGGKLAFERRDECLPFPIPDDARAVLPLFPPILDLSRYTLTVPGLSGDYRLLVDGAELGTVSAKQLADGVNLTTFATGPIADQGRAILAAVAAKEGLVGQWRQQSRAARGAPEARDKLDALTKRVEAADTKIREAATPKALRFEVVPVK
jgi:hypothetical protein